MAEEESRGLDTIRFALETTAAILAQRMANSRLLAENVESYVSAAACAPDSDKADTRTTFF